jgi:hypothetical protein
MVGKASLFVSDDDFEAERENAPPEKLIRWLADRFGDKVETIEGRWFFSSAVAIGEGCSVHWGHDSGSVAIEFTGSRLSTMTMPERVSLMRDLSEWGAVATRVDVCADFRLCSFRLFHRAMRSHRRGEVCRTRTVSPWVEYRGGKYVGKTVYLGKRGKNGSGRYGRIYDKGLESKTAPEGQWERYEVEFTKATAAAVCAAIAYSDNAVETCRGYLFGAFDFRLDTGAPHLDDRPRCAWWQRVIDATQTTRFSEKRPAANVMRYARHFGRCYARTLRAMAAHTGMTVADVVEALSDNSPPPEMKAGSVLDQFVKWHKDPARSEAVLSPTESEALPI